MISEMKIPAFLLVMSFYGTGFRAQAAFQNFLEAKVHYSYIQSRPDLRPVVLTGTSPVPNSANLNGVGADVVYYRPLLGVGIGLRYENLGYIMVQGTEEYKASTSRVAVLGSYRFLNDSNFIGFVGTYGFSHSGDFSVCQDSTVCRGQGFYERELTSSQISSYTLGLEAGFRIGGFLFGTEVGYINYLWKAMRDRQGADLGAPKLDFSGNYIKFFLGFGL